MSKKTEDGKVLLCDCGCGYSAFGSYPWIKLSQNSPSHAMAASNMAKIDRELHFISFECLKKWVDKAAKALPVPRRNKSKGTGVKGLYV